MGHCQRRLGDISVKNADLFIHQTLSGNCIVLKCLGCLKDLSKHQPNQVMCQGYVKGTDLKGFSPALKSLVSPKAKVTVCHRRLHPIAVIGFCTLHYKGTCRPPRSARSQKRHRKLEESWGWGSSLGSHEARAQNHSFKELAGFGPTCKTTLSSFC